ncbi:MAG: phytoene/squalene synthase family protein [Gammaproteobacteria bacterium]|nr:phytoene/squalene synthase family protein [Gammaproteobacteria bacterium]
MSESASELLEAADIATCRELLRHGSRSFHAASHLLPSALREGATALYGFCREADDAIDQTSEPAQALVTLEHRLRCLHAGAPFDIASDRAFAAVVRRYRIPHEIPAALLEGFAWDAENRRYADFPALLAYAARVAGTVGVMMARVMGVDEPRLLARASDLGVAMQLTNIARDVGEDARAGRLYLPLAWLAAEGIDERAWLAAPEFNPGIARVVARLLEAAETLYRKAEDGIAGLPLACRPAMYAARYLYAGIGHQVARNGFDSVSVRARVGRTRKCWYLTRALVSTLRLPSRDHSPTVAEAMFLVRAVAGSAADALGTAPAAVVPWWNLDARVERLIAIFERLERRERDTQSMRAVGAS